MIYCLHARTLVFFLPNALGRKDFICDKILQVFFMDDRVIDKLMDEEIIK